jgi:hypothetical protein
LGALRLPDSRGGTRGQRHIRGRGWSCRARISWNSAEQRPSPRPPKASAPDRRSVDAIRNMAVSISDAQPRTRPKHGLLSPRRLKGPGQKCV